MVIEMRMMIGCMIVELVLLRWVRIAVIIGRLLVITRAVISRAEVLLLLLVHRDADGRVVLGLLRLLR